MKKYRLKSGRELSKMDMLVVLDWCKKKLGRSKYYSIKKLKLRINTKTNYLGLFDTGKNTIHVNPDAHENIVHLIETIIHEYVHFKQNPKEYDRLRRVFDFEDYFEHPHEQEAETIALNLGRICYFELRKHKKI